MYVAGRNDRQPICMPPVGILDLRASAKSRRDSCRPRKVGTRKTEAPARASLWPITKVRSLAATAVSGTSTGRFGKLRLDTREAQMTAPSFIFATGIENSNPTIKNGTVRVDELEKGGHYEHWQTDFALLQDLDIRFLRYGPPMACSRSLRLGLRGPDIRALEEAQHHSDRRSLPLRRARLDRELPKPGFSSALCRVRANFRQALSLGATLHPGERDVCLRYLFGRIWLVE